MGQRKFPMEASKNNKEVTFHSCSFLRLQGKPWDAILPAEFACKPELTVPVERVFGSEGVDVTLACNIVGSPVPQVRWVMDGRILNNNTSPAAFATQRYLLREQAVSHDGVERWYNLVSLSESRMFWLRGL